MNDSISIYIDKKHLPFLFIVFFVFLNALFNSLSAAYGIERFPYDTFLFYASDLHADLIKMAFGYLPNNIQLDVSQWDPLYQHFYQLHLEGWFQKHHFNNEHMPPFSYLIGWVMSNILKSTSPFITVSLFYSFAISTIVAIAWYIKNDIKYFYIIIAGTILSYPFLFVLVRGNVFSLINSIAIIGFIILVLSKRDIWIAILLLAVSINIRPNAFILSFIFFVFPPKKALSYIAVSGVAAISLFYISLFGANTINSLYTLQHFIDGLDNYMQLYVTGKLGVLFNNSLYGAIRSLFIAWKIHIPTALLLMINQTITVVGIVVLIATTYLKIKKRLSDFEYAFVVTGIYTLVSTVFSAYHLLPFIVFLLYPFLVSDTKRLSTKRYDLIVYTSVFLLIPKNYIFIDFVYKNFLSIETIINPIVLLCSLTVILIESVHSHKEIDDV